METGLGGNEILQSSVQACKVQCKPVSSYYFVVNVLGMFICTFIGSSPGLSSPGRDITILLVVFYGEDWLSVAAAVLLSP